MVKVKNPTKHDVSEFIFGHGTVVVEAGKTANIHDDVWALWSNPARQEVVLEIVTAEERSTSRRTKIEEPVALEETSVEIDL